jgi:molecular chaperone GrpE
MEKELQQEEAATYKPEEATGETEETSEQTQSVQTEEQTEEKDELTAAKERIAELEEKLQELETRYLRLHADFDNFRRRTRLDFEAAEKYRAQSLVTDILPALDNFERALKVEAEDDKTKSILQGMEMVYRSLIDALKKEGVEVIEAVGKPFDPHLHQAVMQVEDSNYEPNTVVEEFQKGYKLKDRVIRPSMVKVSQ